MSKWLSVFGRDFYGNVDPCIENLYGVCLDGVDDYLINSGGTLQPTSVASKQWVSVWVKDLDTVARNEGEFIFTQSVPNNNQEDFWRIVYNTNNSSGNPLNVITVEWRASTNSNRALKQYRLHENTAITGSNNNTDFWLDGNTNINTTTDGYVHILAIWDVPATGSNMLGNANISLYWNGQLLSAYNTAFNGTSQTTAFNGTNLYLGTNGSNISGAWKGQMDEVFITNPSNGTIIMTEKNLSNNQDIADYFYNTGCPGDIGNDSRWNFNWWRFENTWTAESGSNAWSPINGPTFGTFPNGCSFAAATVSCTTNYHDKIAWHPQFPQTTSGSSDIKTMVTNKTWSATTTTALQGAMTWLAIDLTTPPYASSLDTSTNDIYNGIEYWVRMYRADGDGNNQQNPSVAGGSSAPNVLHLEEKNLSTGALTGNTITFQCIEDATSLAFGGEFIFKAKVTGSSGYGSTTPSYQSNSGPTLDPNSIGFCTTWSSTTPIVTCDSPTALTATNEYMEDFTYPSNSTGSGTPTGGGGGAIGQ